MLGLLDKLLREFLVTNQIGLLSSDVWFEAPIHGWPIKMGATDRIALNIYLVDLRENRKLRSNERERTIVNGIVEDQPVPALLDCHYLISAWDPGTLSASIEPTLSEHAILYKVTAVLMKNYSLNPSTVYSANPIGSDHWPDKLWDAEFQLKIVPSEGFPKLSEFWNSMGQGSNWKPVIYLIVTIPVELTRVVAGPMVTTRITEYRQTGKPETAEVWIEIGGIVYDSTKKKQDGSPVPPEPVSDAWVELETVTGETLRTTTTNDLGQFTFAGLTAGHYWIKARVEGFNEYSEKFAVPSPTGKYDLILSMKDIVK
jgi:hypothetical protein